MIRLEIRLREEHELESVAHFHAVKRAQESDALLAEESVEATRGNGVAGGGGVGAGGQEESETGEGEGGVLQLDWAQPSGAQQPPRRQLLWATGLKLHKQAADWRQQQDLRIKKVRPRGTPRMSPGVAGW